MCLGSTEQEQEQTQDGTPEKDTPLARALTAALTVPQLKALAVLTTLGGAAFTKPPFMTLMVASHFRPWVVANEHDLSEIASGVLGALENAGVPVGFLDDEIAALPPVDA